MANVQPFRDDTLKDATQMRVRLNQLVDAVNASPGQWSAIRVPNVQNGTPIVIKAPPFQVGSVVLGGITPTNGASALSVAPFVNWSQLGDGRLSISVVGLGAFPALYSVNLVLLEGEAAT